MLVMALALVTGLTFGALATWAICVRQGFTAMDGARLLTAHGAIVPLQVRVDAVSKRVFLVDGVLSCALSAPQADQLSHLLFLAVQEVSGQRRAGSMGSGHDA